MAMPAIGSEKQPFKPLISMTILYGNDDSGVPAA
jgi:hypothetical protein